MIHMTRDSLSGLEVKPIHIQKKFCKSTHWANYLTRRMRQLHLETLTGSNKDEKAQGQLASATALTVHQFFVQQSLKPLHCNLVFISPLRKENVDPNIKDGAGLTTGGQVLSLSLSLSLSKGCPRCQEVGTRPRRRTHREICPPG